MKCPKCGYRGFSSTDRCRYCGYDFSLAASPDGAPLTPSPRPRATPLNQPPTPRHEPGATRAPHLSRGGSRLDSALDRPLTRTPDSAPLDLPLFDFDVEAGRLPTPHRPLQVRMSGHPTPRARSRAASPTPGASLDLYAQPLAESPAPEAPGPASREEPSATARPSPAPPALWLTRRAAAAAVDLALIVLVDLVTVYFALRLCGLEPAEWDLLPRLPLAAFFIILNGGYVVLLTGLLGQTLGKMALQVEVVADSSAPVGLSRSSWRAVLALATLLPAGIGLLWALLGDRRPLHDRLAGTRVIRVSAA